MSLPTAYLMTTKNVEKFFNSILSAQAPERFTQKFLENLELKSTNDRLFISLMKSLGFIDEGGIPTQRYFDFLDQTQAKTVLADAIKDTYSDLFTVKKDAYNLTVEETKNKLKTLTQGQKTDKVLNLMANTFRSLCDYAEWKTDRKIKKEKSEFISQIDTNIVENNEKKTDQKSSPSLNYNIQIHLPETRDNSVYDAIFRSLKEHLL